MTPASEPFTWRTVNDETGEMRRFYEDGAALVVTGTRAPHGFWQKHPLVAEAHETPAVNGGATVRIFLGRLDAPDAPETTRPDRAADIELVGEWKTEHDFWAAHPAAEHVEVQQLVGDDPAGDCWTLSMWLKG